MGLIIIGSVIAGAGVISTLVVAAKDYRFGAPPQSHGVEQSMSSAKFSRM